MLDSLAERRFTPIAAEHHHDIADRVCPMRYEISERVESPQRKLSGCRIGAVSLAAYEGCGIEHGQRTMEHIRAESLDYFIVCLPLQARFHFSHGGLHTDIGYGAAVLLSAQQPFDAYVDGGAPDASHSSLQLRVPGPLLRSRAPQVDQVCNRLFSVQSGAGLILQAALQASLKTAATLDVQQAQRHGRIVVDLVANALHDLDADRGLQPRRAGTQALFERAMAYIECELSTPHLGAEEIARHCHVSARYLHKVFGERSLTVAGCIRDLRLQRCQSALRDVRLARRTVIEIAGRWGFNDPSHFGRLYKKHFGISPSEERPNLTTASS